MSLEIRKLETELIALKEKEQSAQATAKSEVSTPTTSAVSQKRYQIKLNGYGNYCTFFQPILIYELFNPFSDPIKFNIIILKWNYSQFCIVYLLGIDLITINVFNKYNWFCTLLEIQ